VEATVIKFKFVWSEEAAFLTAEQERAVAHARREIGASRSRAGRPFKGTVPGVPLAPLSDVVANRLHAEGLAVERQGSDWIVVQQPRLNDKITRTDQGGILSNVIRPQDVDLLSAEEQEYLTLLQQALLAAVQRGTGRSGTLATVADGQAPNTRALRLFAQGLGLHGWIVELAEDCKTIALTHPDVVWPPSNDPVAVVGRLRSDARREGLCEGLRKGVRLLCELLAIPVTEEREGSLMEMNRAELDTLLEQLRTMRRWD
jgi:hypothetical protein